MEEEIIDSVLATNIEEGDLIDVRGSIETVSLFSEEGDWVNIFTKETGPEDPAVVVRWDDSVTLYGY